MLYAEKSPKTWSAICISVYLVGMGYMGIDTIPDEFGLWLGMCALFLLLLLPCLVVPFSKFIYNRIQIDTQTLRVGRERIALAEIEPASVQAAASQTGSPAGAPTSFGQSNARLVGGGWAVPMGMASVVIRTRQGEHLRIATRDRTAFLAALTQAATNSSWSSN
ncbi:hypothetical protein [Streptomyces sp. NPDC001020]